ncbi:MAG: class I SAM-dependent methyltransferase [Rhodoferax sp.]
MTLQHPIEHDQASPAERGTRAKTPNRELALKQYRLRSRFYDIELAAFEPIRRSAIARLQLKPGATVLDVGCGTGLSFELLKQGIGRRGHIVGIEQSPEMLEQARRRVARQGWTHVTLLNAPVEAAVLPSKADAALFHFTHDILRNREAIGNIVQHLKPGAHVVAAGLAWGAPWNLAANGFVLMAALYSVTALEGLARPWSHLAEQVGEMEVTQGAGVYIASTVVAR